MSSLSPAAPCWFSWGARSRASIRGREWLAARRAAQCPRSLLGHTSDFTTPAGQFCLPGQVSCDSYDTPHWLGFSPLQIKSVTFANGSTANKWAVVSDFGGTAEVNQYCPSYGGPYCTYPWYAFNGTDSAFSYGADYPGTRFDYGQANQFATTTQCGGPFGPGSTYCDTMLSPTP